MSGRAPRLGEAGGRGGRLGLARVPVEVPEPGAGQAGVAVAGAGAAVVVGPASHAGVARVEDRDDVGVGLRRPVSAPAVVVVVAVPPLVDQDVRVLAGVVAVAAGTVHVDRGPVPVGVAARREVHVDGQRIPQPRVGGVVEPRDLLDAVEVVERGPRRGRVAGRSARRDAAVLPLLEPEVDAVGARPGFGGRAAGVDDVDVRAAQVRLDGRGRLAARQVPVGVGDLLALPRRGEVRERHREARDLAAPLGAGAIGRDREHPPAHRGVLGPLVEGADRAVERVDLADPADRGVHLVEQKAPDQHVPQPRAARAGPRLRLALGRRRVDGDERQFRLAGELQPGRVVAEVGGEQVERAGGVDARDAAGAGKAPEVGPHQDHPSAHDVEVEPGVLDADAVDALAEDELPAPVPQPEAGRAIELEDCRPVPEQRHVVAQELPGEPVEVVERGTGQRTLGDPRDPAPREQGRQPRALVEVDGPLAAVPGLELLPARSQRVGGVEALDGAREHGHRPALAVEDPGVEARRRAPLGRCERRSHQRQENHCSGEHRPVPMAHEPLPARRAVFFRLSRRRGRRCRRRSLRTVRPHSRSSGLSNWSRGSPPRRRRSPRPR